MTAPGVILLSGRQRMRAVTRLSRKRWPRAPSNIENLAFLGGPDFPELSLEGSTVLIAYMLAWLGVSRPHVAIDSYLSAQGREALQIPEQYCYADGASHLAGVTIGDLLSKSFNDPVFLEAAGSALHVPIPDTTPFVARILAR